MRWEVCLPRKKKVFDLGKEVKAIARERVGRIPAEKTINRNRAARSPSTRSRRRTKCSRVDLREVDGPDSLTLQ